MTMQCHGAVVDLPDGSASLYPHYDADEYEPGELTLTHRITGNEHVYPKGSWYCVTQFDDQGRYLYIIDRHVRVKVVQAS